MSFGMTAVKVLWCWRCKMDIPMLDDVEFERVRSIGQECARDTKEFRRKYNLPLSAIDLATRFRPMLDEYEKITGFRETNPNAVWHHCISQYGPPCANCGHILRTPVASKCFECGHVRKLPK